VAQADGGDAGVVDLWTLQPACRSELLQPFEVPRAFAQELAVRFGQQTFDDFECVPIGAAVGSRRVLVMVPMNSCAAGQGSAQRVCDARSELMQAFAS
jgi:hypothetical protein